MAALVKLSVDVSESESRELAVLDRLNTALEKLRERLKIRRAARGVGVDERSQLRLAIFELVAEAHSGADGVGEVIRRGVEAEASAAAQRLRVESEIKAAERIFDENRGSSAAQRQFIRRADRLRTQQVNRLRASIFDSQELSKVISMLDDLYAHYIEQALNPGVS